MPNPLTDELSPQAKAELAAIFAAMRRHCDAMWTPPATQGRRQRQFWERSGW